MLSVLSDHFGIIVVPQQKHTLTLNTGNWAWKSSKTLETSPETSKSGIYNIVQAGQKQNPRE